MRKSFLVVATGLSAMVAPGAAGGAIGAAAAATVVGPGDAPAVGNDYFIRPYVLLDDAAADGLDVNGATSGTSSYDNGVVTLESRVDLGAGTIKAYLAMEGPTASGALATGVMGDVIRFDGPADTLAHFAYSYETILNGFQMLVDPTPTDFRYLGLQVDFAIYSADSNATYMNWTEAGANAGEALYIGSDSYQFDGARGWFSDSYQNTLSADLYLDPGAYYKVYASFNLAMIPGQDYSGLLELDATHSAAIGIAADAGTFTSLSGAFLGFPAGTGTPGDGGSDNGNGNDNGNGGVGAVPEPASWMMLIAGFGLVGGAVRRRRVAFS